VTKTIFIFRERRVERDGQGDPALGEHVELILHQGDQRRDDDRRPRQQQCGQLITQRLPRSGGQDRQRIFARKDAPEHLFLTGVEVLVPEFLAQLRAQLVRRHGSFSPGSAGTTRSATLESWRRSDVKAGIPKSRWTRNTRARRF